MVKNDQKMGKMSKFCKKCQKSAKNGQKTQIIFSTRAVYTWRFLCHFFAKNTEISEKWVKNCIFCTKILHGAKFCKICCIFKICKFCKFCRNLGQKKVKFLRIIHKVWRKKMGSKMVENWKNTKNTECKFFFFEKKRKKNGSKMTQKWPKNDHFLTIFCT